MPKSPGKPPGKPSGPLSEPYTPTTITPPKPSKPKPK